MKIMKVRIVMMRLSMPSRISKVEHVECRRWRFSKERRTSGGSCCFSDDVIGAKPKTVLAGGEVEV